MGNDEQKDKRQTIESWVNLYGDECYSWAFYKTSSREVAEDIVQDTFLSALKSFDSFENRSKPKTWLFTILNNKIKDYYRKASRSFESIDSVAESDSIHAAYSIFDENNNWNVSQFGADWGEEQHLLDNPRFNEMMENCMNTLPDNWKLALTAKFVLDKKASEICQELNITSSNYWQMIHRAKLLLKKCIDKKWQP
jgi:RNA polymerase sigma-70 factor (TIGR02943 family)